MKPILISMPPDEERTGGLVALLGCGTRAATEGAAAGRSFNPPEKFEAGGRESGADGEGVRGKGCTIAIWEDTTYNSELGRKSRGLREEGGEGEAGSSAQELGAGTRRRRRGNADGGGTEKRGMGGRCQGQ